jgi:hypothetical protein
MHDVQDKKIAIPPHLIDLEECVTPKGPLFRLYHFVPQYRYFTICTGAFCSHIPLWNALVHYTPALFQHMVEAEREAACMLIHSL